MTVSYEQARAWAEDRLSFWEEWASGHEDGDDCPQGHSVIWQERATRTRADIAALRALLSGPPEPSEEEVGETIGYYFGTLVSRNPQPDMSGDPRAKLQPHIRRQFDSAAREAAQAVLALFRSRING